MYKKIITLTIIALILSSSQPISSFPKVKKFVEDKYQIFLEIDSLIFKKSMEDTLMSNRLSFLLVQLKNYVDDYNLSRKDQVLINNYINTSRLLADYKNYTLARVNKKKVYNLDSRQQLVILYKDFGLISAEFHARFRKKYLRHRRCN